MKDLFLAVLRQLQTCTGIRWIDMDKDQLNAANRPTLAYPAALVTVSVGSIADAASDVDIQTATVTVRLVFDTAAARTAATTPAEALEQSLQYLQTETEVYELFRTFEPDTNAMWSTFACRERQPEPARSDGLVVMRLRWETIAIF